MAKDKRYFAEPILTEDKIKGFDAPHYVSILESQKNEVNETLKLIHTSLERILDVIRDMRGR